MFGSFTVIVAFSALTTSVSDASVIASSQEAPSLKLPTFVNSHMVLAREPLRARLWGWASPEANVTATLDGTMQGFAIADDKDGSWTIELPSQPAGADHVIQISDGETLHVLEDVAFGDVYLCSGQSNMEMSISGAFNATAEIADSVHYPHLRLAELALTRADTPQEDAPSRTNYAWARSGPSAMAINDGDFSWFSATCYFFGREVYKRLDGAVPIGLVASAWGGQKVEAFSSPEALADETCGGTRSITTRSAVQKMDSAQEASHEKNDGPQLDYDGVRPTQLWNAMIKPLTPIRFVGAVWYQGEANAGDESSYACRFPAMIADWRLKFGLPNLSFFYVQLAAYNGDSRESGYAYIRAAQDAALPLPNVGVAVAIDIGDPASPDGSIHPRRKQEVGRRLALNAAAIEYRQRVVYKGPVLVEIQLTSSGAILSFERGTANGLHLEGTAACTECCYESPFEVLDAKGNWTRATPTVTQEKIHLESLSGPTLGIRLDWEGYPQCAVYNGHGGPDDHAGLPARPFEWCLYPTGKDVWSRKACGTREDSMNILSRRIITLYF